MGHFDQEYLEFFSELAFNNNKTWFDQNRQRYEKSVKKPFYNFVEEMIVRIHSRNPDILINPSEAIFRINRDIRFSKNKTPYKLHMGAFISPGGRKAKNDPGFYFHLGFEGIRIYSGVYQVPKDNLLKIRRHIADKLDSFEKIIAGKAFKSKFGSIQGDRHQRISAEFKQIAEKQLLISNKDFYVSALLDEKRITNPDLSDQLMDYYLAVEPLLIFLNKALC